MSPQSPADSGTLTLTGNRGVDAGPWAGFGIYYKPSDGSTRGFAALPTGGKRRFHRVDFLNGEASLVGSSEAGCQIVDIAMPLNQSPTRPDRCGPGESAPARTGPHRHERPWREEVDPYPQLRTPRRCRVSGRVTSLDSDGTSGTGPVPPLPLGIDGPTAPGPGSLPRGPSVVLASASRRRPAQPPGTGAAGLVPGPDRSALVLCQAGSVHR
ncbi:DUF4394 domain-containing protein [Streptomyces sp. NPDC001770]